MNILMDFQEPVNVDLNFAGDRTDGGVFSSARPDWVRQVLVAAPAIINNARALVPPASIGHEGFTVAPHSSGRAVWEDKAWLESEYIPSCVALVKRLTNAKDAMCIYEATQRNTAAEKRDGEMPSAQFVHIDQPRDSLAYFIEKFTRATGKSLERAAIYNVWKPTSPPPQDVPLAVSDWRSVPESDFVIGRTVEPEGESPYITLAPSPQVKWYYYPDLSTEESLVFTGGNADPRLPLGCAHSAFVHPDPAAHGVPRASIEVRVVAIFE